MYISSLYMSQASTNSPVDGKIGKNMVFEKLNNELNAKKNIEQNVTSYLDEKFNIVKNEIQNQSKIRYDSIENLEQYFESELPKMQTNLKMEQNIREENDNNNVLRLNDEIQKLGEVINNEKKNREETQEGILEMIKIMNGIKSGIIHCSLKL